MLVVRSHALLVTIGHDGAVSQLIKPLGVHLTDRLAVSGQAAII